MPQGKGTYGSQKGRPSKKVATPTKKPLITPAIKSAANQMLSKKKVK